LLSRYNFAVSLRERKKQATRVAIADTALGLFLARGFDQVTVADVARAAQVAVNTVFNYFPTKEDLFFDRQDEVVHRLARAVDARRPGESPAAAVRRAFVEALERDEPTLGLSPDVTAFWRTVEASPALQARLRLMAEQTEALLAAKLAELAEVGGAAGDDPAPRLLAAAIAGVDRALHAEIRRRIQAGEDPAEVRRVVRRAAAGLDQAVLAAVGGQPPAGTG
jgi:AcrR family transcriptional regulator